MDYLFGHLIAQLANILATRRDGKPYKAEDFLIDFKDPTQIAEEQSQAQIENAIKLWVSAANILHQRQLKAKGN